MDQLKQRILRDGRNLGGGILKVDSFINHQVDPALMDACGREFAARFAKVNATKILTAEISGIAPALMTALHLNLPVVYARKTKPITMPDQVFLTLAPSHTKGRMVELIVSPEYLGKGEKVLIIDDFLATGSTIHGLVRLAQTAGDPADLPGGPHVPEGTGAAAVGRPRRPGLRPDHRHADLLRLGQASGRRERPQLFPTAESGLGGSRHLLYGPPAVSTSRRGAPVPPDRGRLRQAPEDPEKRSVRIGS